MNFRTYYERFQIFIKSVWHPRYTTEAAELSRLSNGSDFELTGMDYDDGRINEPTEIKGWITTKSGVKRDVSWNRYGECIYKGNRLSKYDLIHPDSREIATTQLLFIGIIGIALTLIWLVLWN